MVDKGSGAELSHSLVSKTAKPSWLYGGLFGLFVLGSGLLLLLNIKTYFNLYDEGFALFNGVRVLHGDLPHRDFWAIYPPGQSYTLAAVFALWGENVLTARLYDVAVRFLLTLGIYMLARPLTNRWVAFLPAILALLWLASGYFYAYAMFPALACSVWSLVALVGGLNRQHRAWLFLAGLLAGCAGLYRLDVGVYLGLCLTLVTAIYLLFGLGWNRGLKGGLTLGAVWAGGVLVALPFYAYLAWQAGPQTIFQDLLLFPATTLRAVRILPYPDLLPDFSGLYAGDPAIWQPVMNQYMHWLEFYMPLVVYGVAGLALMGRLWIGDRDRSSMPWIGILAVTLFGGLLFLQAMSRYDRIHVLPTTLFGMTAFFALLYQGRTLWRRFWPAAILGTGALVWILYPYAWDPYQILQRASDFTGCYSQLPRAGCTALPSDQEEIALLVDRLAQPDEPIFVGNTRHDRLFISDVGLYFLIGRPSATRYHELHPGVATTQPVQETIVSELESKKVRWVVLMDVFHAEPNASALSSGVTLLDDYLASHYRHPVHAIGRYTLWERTEP